MACMDMKDGYVKIFDIDSEVNVEELDECYIINSRVVYRGYSFEDFNGIKTAWKRGTIFIFTFDWEIAKQLKFDRHDVGTWVLDIPFKEVEKVIIEKEYLAGGRKGKRESYEENIMTFVQQMQKYW